MSKNPTNRHRSRHVEVKVHYLCDLVPDGHVELVKCAGTQNVSDFLTKSLLATRPAFEKHRESFSVCGVPLTNIAPVMAFSCLSSYLFLSSLGNRDVQESKDILYNPHKGRVKYRRIREGFQGP